MSSLEPALSDFLSIDSAELDRLCREYGIVELAVFGSVIRGEAVEGSDVDLLYVVDPKAELGWGIEAFNEKLPAAIGDRSTWCRRSTCMRCSATRSSRKRSRCMQRDAVLIAEMIDAAARAIEVPGTRRADWRRIAALTVPVSPRSSFASTVGRVALYIPGAVAAAGALGVFSVWVTQAQFVLALAGRCPF